MHTGSDRCPACERPLFGDEVRSRAHGWFRVDQVKAQSVSWRVAQVQKPEVGMPIITLGAATPHWQTPHVQHVTCTIYFSYIPRCHMQKSTDGRKTNSRPVKQPSWPFINQHRFIGV